MSLVHWSDRYSVGIEAVDHEHRQLIELINRLYDRIESGKPKDSVTIAFGDLFAAVSAHFALEERLMRDRAYTAFGAHKEDHERLLDEILDTMDGFEDDRQAAGEELAARLEAWFSRHFETHDARLHRTLGDHA